MAETAATGRISYNIPMGRKPRKKLSPARRVLLIAGIASMLLAGWYVWWLFRPDELRPNEYPTDWPLAFVTVPEGAGAGELPVVNEMIHQKRPMGQWGLHYDDGTTKINRRDWGVGFAFHDSLDEACADLEGKLKEHGYLKHPSSNPARRLYYSPDFFMSISLFHQERHVWFLGSQPEAWALEITEIDHSMESFPVPQQCVPIE